MNSHFIITFISTFLISNISDLLVSNYSLDISFHNTYFIVEHFHYVSSLSDIISVLCSFLLLFFLTFVLALLFFLTF